MKNFSKFAIIIVALGLLFLCALSMGEYDITFKESILALFGIGESANVSIVQDVRLPRIVVGFCVGSALAVSGVFIRTALNNPLADSGLLGIQAGATTFALLIILVFPTFYSSLPFFAFLGGMTAFCITLYLSRGRSTTSLIITGVAINAFFMACIGIITTFNVNELQSAQTYLNGSLANTSVEQMRIILFYTTVFLVGSFFFIPTLKLLKLSDNTLVTIGVNAKRMRIIVAGFGVLLASISVAFVGIISFIGIIVPNITSRIIKNNLKLELLMNILLGGFVVMFCDFMQKMIFAPMEIPVGLVIGLVSAPMFIYILRRVDDHN